MSDVEPGRQLVEVMRWYLASFWDDSRVQCENGQRNCSEDHQLSHPRPDGPDGCHAAFRQLRPHGALPALRVELPEVRLDGVEGEWESGQRGDGQESSAGRAEAMTLERMTDGDVTLDGETEDEEWTEVLSRQEDNRKQFTESGHLQYIHTPLGL